MTSATPATRRARRALLPLALLLLGLSLLASAHYYIAKRFVLDPEWPEPWRALALAAIACCFFGMFAALALERGLGLPWLRVVSWPFALWMGLFWLALVGLGIADFSLAAMGAALDVQPQQLARGRALAAGAFALTAAAFALRGGLRVPRVRRVEIALPRWPAALEGFRIAQISDVHIGPVLGRRFAERLVERANALAADLIAVTGDLVDGSVAKIGGEVEPFGALRAPHGVYFVTGNHDFYSGVDGWLGRVRELGLRVLRNERVAIGGAQGFDLAGVDDHRGDWTRGSTEDLARALAGRDPERALVLLAHDPTSFVRAAGAGVDLQLSGHTHGGQIWPFRYLVRLAVPFVAGLYRRGASQLYVSRGSGFWGPPMRLLAPSEITELVIRRAG